MRYILTFLFLLTSVIIIAQDNTAKNDDKPHLGISALIHADGIYDIKQMDPDWIGGFRPSKIPIYSTDPGWGSYGHTYFSVRQSTFKFNGFIPTTSKYGDIHIHFSFDLFGMGVHAGETTLRFRIAYGEFGPFLFGQNWSTFIDLGAFPNNWDWWGPAGMALLPAPMFRYTHNFSDKRKIEAAIELPGSVVDPGQIRKIDPALINVLSKEVLPDLILRYTEKGKWGYFKTALLIRQLTYEVVSQNLNSYSVNNLFGWGANITSAIYTFNKRGTIKTQFVIGNGYAGYSNDSGVEIAPDVNLKPVTPLQYGFVAAYDFNINKKWETSVVYSESVQDNSEGQLFDAFNRSQYFLTQLIYNAYQDKVKLGLSYMWGKRYNKDGNSADDSRVVFSARFLINSSTE
jgi:hypothetical protein